MSTSIAKPTDLSVTASFMLAGTEFEGSEFSEVALNKYHTLDNIISLAINSMKLNYGKTDNSPVSLISLLLESVDPFQVLGIEATEAEQEQPPLVVIASLTHAMFPWLYDNTDRNHAIKSIWFHAHAEPRSRIDNFCVGAGYIGGLLELTEVVFCKDRLVKIKSFNEIDGEVGDLALTVVDGDGKEFIVFAEECQSIVSLESVQARLQQEQSLRGVQSAIDPDLPAAANQDIGDVGTDDTAEVDTSNVVQLKPKTLH